MLELLDRPLAPERMFSVTSTVKAVSFPNLKCTASTPARAKAACAGDASAEAVLHPIHQVCSKLAFASVPHILCRKIPPLSLLCCRAFPDKINKIQTPEMQCRQSLRWKMDGSSTAKATAQKANVTGKLFLIPQSPATRKSLPIPPMPGRS